MGDYNRTIWKDHIKDQNGIVIQQGNPVSAKNLNNIENQLVSLSAKENVLAELVRESIPSGFTSLSDLDYTTMSITPNTIKLLKDSVAYVNGYKVIIPAGTTITLNAPPTSGNREDLVFLEVWKQADANGAEQLNWRIRVVDGVDFSQLQEGFTITGVSSSWNNPTSPRAQGANAQPISTAITNDVSAALTTFVNANYRYSSDKGLYVSGDGSASSKTTLGTTDGCCYAVPMFRIKRRNSGGYSIANANGSVSLFQPTFSMRTGTATSGANGGDTTSWTFANSSDYNNASVGDTFSSADKSQYHKIISKNGNNNVTMQMVKGTGSITFSTGISSYYRINNTPSTLLMSDIIVDRDIIDLRHQVSLVGFNYQALLEENFDKLLRGELQTVAKTAMLKHYHGIPKTPIDANHVFYASFDGTTVAEVGGTPTVTTTPTYGVMPTGLGAFGGTINFNNINLTDNAGTLDIWFKKVGTAYSKMLFSLPNLLYVMSLSTIDGLYVKPYNSDTDSKQINGNKIGDMLHVRISWDSNNFYVRVNGVLIATKPNRHTNVISSLAPSIDNASSGYIISDIAVSNIDRGAVFATLPQDYIDGYARIAPAFNTQRNVFSDALTSEAPLAQVKCAGGNNKELTIGDSTVFPKADTSKWNTGDRIKIRGLGGEIITGVIDADTAIGTLVLADGSPVVTVSDASKFVANDTINLLNTSGSISASITITAVDTTNNKLTLGSTVSSSWNGSLIFETTTSSSSPVVKANLTGTAQSGAASTITLPSTFSATDSAYNGLTITITGGTGAGQVRTISSYVGSTKVATVNSAWATNPDATSTFLITGVPITGTWSNLGTNEATFTLSANSGLVAQDLWINYSLNEVPGQGGISEVLITTLAGESNGKRLTVNPSIHVRDDLAGKIAGDTVACPNIAKYNSGSSLQAPSTFTLEASGTMPYSTMNTLNGTSGVFQTSNNGVIPQQLFSFNLIRILEDKYGKLPCADDTASKVAWLKAVITKITCNWWGYGSCSSGNKASFGLYRNNGQGYAANSNNSSSPALISSISSSISSDVSIFIDTNGFVNTIAYTDASDGVTPSAIYTDYCNIEITIGTSAGYDVLAPENPRRDDGKANMLLVRKETKELLTIFSRSNTDGIITYGDYVPKQGYLIYSNNTATNMTKAKGFLLSNGTGKAASSSNGYWYAIEKANNLNLDDQTYLLNMDDVISSSPNLNGTSWSGRKYYYDNLDIMPCLNGSGNYGYPTDKVLTPNNSLNLVDCIMDIKTYIPLSTLNKLMGLYTIVKYNNELYLVVLARISNISVFSCIPSNSATYNGCFMYKLKNRPLIK